ncbi:VanZ family protein [Clostridium botulinum D/C]|nr:VanZ family protein [Clostridium botulinum D/C]MCD3358583.1 VanZ family protein [Clostridium botulinum D/C]MCD3363931.1 VanZ family protein [Clostridium botulinum D/C]MCD3364388.1 VanZ family protein [Clostridium botulinum D/C]
MNINMTNKSCKRILKYCLVITWMIVIFNFSKDPAEVSNGKSGLVIKLITVMGIDVNGIFGKMANFIIRKVGHFTEYFVLCALIVFSLKNEAKNNRKYIIAIIITFLYACSDEIHQLFVPGRSGRVNDVLIDTAGGILAILIYKGIVKLKK